MFALALAVLAGQAHGRGGGGCLEESTPILTPRGSMPIEKLSVGDAVLSWRDGRLVSVSVQGIVRVMPEEYVSLRVGERLLNLTAEHPVQVDRGTFNMAGKLKVGDSVWTCEAEAMGLASVREVSCVPAVRPAYNLLVGGGTYLANGVVVHNKGCFLPDTPILRADGGQTAIKDVKAGDRLMAFDTDGHVINAAVRQVIVHEVDEYCRVSTEHVELRVTPEHPFYVGDGVFKTMEALRPGDSVFAYDGRTLVAQKIVQIEWVAARVKVYNLQTDWPHTYFAAGIAVHNKGGGGGSHGGGFSGRSYSAGHYRSGSSSTRPYGSGGGWGVPLGCGALITTVMVASVLNKRRKNGGDLDLLYSRPQIDGKAARAERLLESLAKRDGSMAPNNLKKVAQTTFTLLQQCWEERDYRPMKALLMNSLFEDHLAQIAGMLSQHEINRIENLSVEAIDVVNVRHTQDPNQRQFTALITAKARDYYIDDRNQEFIRGDRMPSRFQEFWTFQQQQGRWLLRDIEQARESDALRDENFVEGMDVRQLEGPGSPVAASGKDDGSRVAQQLRRLEKQDPTWNLSRIKDRVRSVFLHVVLAREAADQEGLTNDELFPELLATYRDECSRRRAEGIVGEYRNLCVRKIDLALARNFPDKSKDEFVARIYAHAQRIMRRGGETIMQDPDVTAFVEYWIFGRSGGQWKLKQAAGSAGT